MADPYLIFPGTAGNYISTDDVNLLDADSAHVYQSAGYWAAIFRTSIAVTADAGSVFGDNALVVTATSDGANGFFSTDTTTVAVTAGNTYTAGFSAKSSVAAMQVRVGIVWYDGGDVKIGDTDLGQFTDITADFTTVSHTSVAPVGAVGMRFECASGKNGGGNVLIGETLSLCAAILREGTDATFVPSVRIVGDYEYRWEGAPTDATPSTPQVGIGFFYSAGTTSFITTAGHLGFYLAPSAGAAANVQSPVPVFTVNGEAVETRTTWSRSGQLATFYANGVQVGDPMATALPNENWIVNASQKVMVGSRSAGTVEMFSGDMYWAEIRDGIDGPVVARFDAGDVPQPAQLPI